MSKTTIELPESLRDRLKDERLPHESNYGDTVARLLDEDTGGQLWTEAEIRDIAHDEVESLARGGR